jgi:hypothetical protein
MAGGAIDPSRSALPEILDPRQVKGHHSGVPVPGCSMTLAGFVNGKSRPPSLGSIAGTAMVNSFVIFSYLSWAKV